MSRRAFVSFGLLTTLVLWITWPLVIHLNSAATPGFESSKTVLLLNEWTIGWNADRTAQGWRDYWIARHFFPEEQSLALSEPIFSSLVVAPLVWLTGTPVMAYNVFLLCSLLLNGWVTSWVLRARQCHWLLSLIGGWSMIVLPFVYEQLGVLQSVPLAGILATIHFTADALETNQRRSFLGAGLSLGLTYWTCAYYGLFTVILLAFVCTMNAKGLVTRLIQANHNKTIEGSSSSLTNCGPRARAFQNLGLGVAVAAILIGPIALTQSRVLSNPAYARSHEAIRDLSALPSDYLATPFPEFMQFFGLAQWHDPTRWALSPGLGKLVLAFVGICVGLRSSRRRPWTLFLITLTLGAFVTSLGLNLRVATWSPYELLLNWVPGLSQVRAPGRFVVFVQIGVVFLLMEALQFFHRWSTVVWRHSQRAMRNGKTSSGCRSRRTALLFVLTPWCAGALACCEVQLPMIRLAQIPAVVTQQGWIGWIKEHTPRETVIAHLPFPTGKSADDYELEAWAMYWSLFHERRLINGYSGFFPPSYLLLKAQMKHFPDRDSIQALRNSGIRYVVIQNNYAQSKNLLSNRLVMENLEFQWQDERAGQLIFGLISIPSPVESP